MCTLLGRQTKLEKPHADNFEATLIIEAIRQMRMNIFELFMDNEINGLLMHVAPNVAVSSFHNKVCHFALAVAHNCLF